MDPEIKALLEENVRLTKENNHYLRQLRRYTHIGVALKVVFWAIVLGVPVFLWRLYFPTGGGESIIDLMTDLESLKNLPL